MTQTIYQYPNGYAVSVVLSEDDDTCEVRTLQKIAGKWIPITNKSSIPIDDVTDLLKTTLARL
jgi:hypothetical protein